MTDLLVTSDAAGRMRVKVPWVRADSRRAVAVEEAVDRQHGVRAVHAYPHTGSVVVWYSPKRCDRRTDLASVAAGRFDGFWEFGLKPWDTAAGVLLIEEAGGKVSDFAGHPYQLGGPVILATNGIIHEEARGAAHEISQRDPSAPLRR